MSLFENLSQPLHLLGFYLAAGTCYYGLLFWRQSRGWKISDWEESFSMLFVPIALLGLLLMTVIATPYFWLYPERHMHIADLEGTDEEKRRLEQYREYRRKVGIWRRIAERAGWRPFDKPPDSFFDGKDVKD
jgi:hypothetical protein